MNRGSIDKRAKHLKEQFVKRAERVTLPFFDGVPLNHVLSLLWRSMVDGAITTRASAIAFSFFIAFFPFVIFLFTMIPYIPIENFQDELLVLIEQVVPVSVFESIEDTLTSILKQPRGDLLSIGFLMALLFSTNGIAAMMSAFDATIHSYHPRSWISQRLAALYLMIILSFLLTLAIALLIGGQTFINYLVREHILRDNLTVYLLTIGKWIVNVALFFFAYSFLYYMAPAKKMKWRFISAGGTLATLLNIIAIVGFSFYINNFGQYNILYGSIGTLLIILLLMYLMSLILLIGFELNVSIYEAKTQKDG